MIRQLLNKSNGDVFIESRNRFPIIDGTDLLERGVPHIGGFKFRQFENDCGEAWVVYMSLGSTSDTSVIWLSGTDVEWAWRRVLVDQNLEFKASGWTLSRLEYHKLMISIIEMNNEMINEFYSSKEIQ